MISILIIDIKSMEYKEKRRPIRYCLNNIAHEINNKTKYVLNTPP